MLKLALSVLALSTAMVAQAPEPPLLLTGTPLVGFEASYGQDPGSNRGPSDDGPRLPFGVGHTCAASYAVSNGAPATTAAWQAGLRVFNKQHGNCGRIRPRGCSFSGSLRVNNTSAREIEVCPPGVRLGSPSCVKIPAGGFYRFTGISIALPCNTTRNTDSMEIDYFDPVSGQQTQGEIEFVCAVCR